VSAGKTIASLLAFVIAVQAAPRHGVIIMCGKTLQTIERNLIEPLQSSELFGPIAAEVHHTRGSTTAVIMGRTVHLIGAANVLAEDKIRGLTVSLAYVDEATLMPRGFWMMLLSRLRVPGARLLATTNPDGPAHWLRKDFILRAGEVNLAHWHFGLEDNPSLTEDYKRDLVAQYVGLWHRRFIAGEWCLAEGAVYEMWHERMIVDELPQIRHWIGVGVDHGTTNAFSAHILGLGLDNRLYLTHEYRYDSRVSRHKLTNPEYSERLRGWLADAEREDGARPDWIYVDPAAADFSLQLFRDGVLNVANAVNDVLPGIRTLSGLMATDRFRVVRACKGFTDEVPGYSWDDKAAQKGEDKPVKVDDHSLDDTRYVVHSTEHLWRPALHVPIAA
jgi:PBSX family phage terminase large subunit